MDKRKILLTVIGVAVLLIASIFLFKKKTSPPPPTSPQPVANEPVAPLVFKNIVTYQDGVFTPANFSVKVGTTVSFVNKSDENMWVAANPHPTHTSLPSFDAKHPYKPGETYKYTFVKKGSFGYHDHLNPMARGTLTVN